MTSSQTITAKNEFRALVAETVTMALANGLSLDRLRGAAFSDAERDGPITASDSFGTARDAVVLISDFAARIGATEATRVLLQFVYQYFARVDSVRIEEAVFESLWADFTTEVQKPRWVTRGLANIRNFASEALYLDLGDGIVIRGRSFPDLRSLGFEPTVLDRLSEDWSGIGASSFVVVSEHSTPKQPENIITLASQEVWTKAVRTLGTLRLADAGSVSIGPMWVIRAAQFDFGIRGIHQYGVSIPGSGSRYVWSSKVERLFPQIYGELKQLEQQGYGRSPGNLAVALRAFMATYDRWPPGQDSQLLDCVTALEALLGTETEISFKLAFRIAALLAESDGKRAEILKLMKEFYDTRNKIVHGSELKEKHLLRLQKIDDLRVLVRRILRSFVTFAAAPPGAYSKAFFQEQLDLALVDAIEREKLRTALHLDHD